MSKEHCKKGFYVLAFPKLSAVCKDRSTITNPLLSVTHRSGQVQVQCQVTLPTGEQSTTIEVVKMKKPPACTSTNCIKAEA